MKKNIVTILVLHVACLLHAQDVKNVIAAEKAFAKTARDENTRAAFLKFTDDSSIVFANGERQKAKETWQAKKISPVKLLWTPAFAGIAASGEFGFTTGPYEVRRSLQDTVVAAGEYTTIWRLTPDNEWKFVADLGTGFSGKGYSADMVEELPVAKTVHVSSANSAMDIERSFLAAVTKDRKAWKKSVDKAAWLINDQDHPWHGGTLSAGIARIPQEIEMIPVGSGLSRSGDFIYIYGDTRLNGKKENYLRVWRRSGKTWKIVLQVLKWQ